jgi:hypothetical protein
MTCIGVPRFPAEKAKAARLINDIVIGKATGTSNSMATITAQWGVSCSKI